MAEGGEVGGEGLQEFMTRKVGPFPVIVYLVLFVGVWYYIERKKSSSSSSSTTSTTGTTTSNYGTDPAGNTGVIDPQTGYVEGTTEDTAALQQLDSSTSSSTTYSDNAAWATAAINYLVGLGEDATAANTAIENYLQSQTLTTAQQAMVNSAILALGSPPDPPTASTSTTVVAPPGGATTYATNPPTGLTVAAQTASSVTLKWNAATNATGYSVTVTPTGSNGTAQTVTTTTPAATIGGLAAQTSYSVKVQATPADSGAAQATTSFTTTYGVTGPTGNPVASGGQSALTPGQVISVPVLITGGKSMASVAKQFGISTQHLIDFNPGSNANTTGTVNVPYLVKKGDTITSIAQKFGISPEHLEQDLSSEGVI